MGTTCWDQKSLRGLRKSNNVNMAGRWENNKFSPEYHVDDRVEAPPEWGRKQ